MEPLPSRMGCSTRFSTRQENLSSALVSPAAARVAELPASNFNDARFTSIYRFELRRYDSLVHANHSPHAGVLPCRL